MIKRSFCIGSEWLFFKIYTGVRTSDIILTEKLYPIISLLIENRIITKWFFIRYNDPDDHIRLRLNCNSIEKTSSVINQLYPVFNELIESDIIWKLQTDTYNRELERYGENTMIDSESIFYHDSEMILDYISLKPYFEKEQIQLYFTFIAIDSFLNSFSLTISEKFELMDSLQESFKKEFDASKQLKKEFDKSYRELSHEIEYFLTTKKSNEYQQVYNIIHIKEIKIENVVNEIKKNIQIPLNSFLSSHIHMMINRQFTSKQRNYECLIYDHLYRYYKKVFFQRIHV